jgi:hypothetical protein
MRLKKPLITGYATINSPNTLVITTTRFNIDAQTTTDL